MGWGRRFIKNATSWATLGASEGKFLKADELGKATVDTFSLGATNLTKEGEDKKRLARIEESDKRNAALAEQARLRNVAEESVRQQEEQARRRTIFGGASIDEQNQRKTLLGL